MCSRPIFNATLCTLVTLPLWLDVRTMKNGFQIRNVSMKIIAWKFSFFEISSSTMKNSSHKRLASNYNNFEPYSQPTLRYCLVNTFEPQREVHRLHLCYRFIENYAYRIISTKRCFCRLLKRERKNISYAYLHVNHPRIDQS